MKLRNKKTGEIRGAVLYVYGGYDYNTLAELNEEWEDCKPKEPLVKDEKIKNLLGEVVEMELTVNELSRRFNEFNKHFVELNAEWEDVKEPLIKC